MKIRHFRTSSDYITVQPIEMGPLEVGSRGLDSLATSNSIQRKRHTISEMGVFKFGRSPEPATSTSVIVFV